MDKPAKAYHELSCYYTWMGDDEIARTKVKNGAEISISDAKANSEVVNSFERPSQFPIIVDTTDIKSISKEARDHFSMRNRESRVIGIAIIRQSTLSNMVANFFIGLNKPAVPVRLFKEEKEAIKWCNKIKSDTNGLK